MTDHVRVPVSVCARFATSLTAPFLAAGSFAGVSCHPSREFKDPDIRALQVFRCAVPGGPWMSRQLPQGRFFVLGRCLTVPGPVEGLQKPKIAKIRPLQFLPERRSLGSSSLDPRSSSPRALRSSSSGSEAANRPRDPTLRKIGAAGFGPFSASGGPQRAPGP